ncbi:MAG TPA: hypothetical protein VFB73_01490 [Chloroflexota bacterium]|nr:hypothetical protein [Chloroflexota bacterium]
MLWGRALASLLLTAVLAASMPTRASAGTLSDLAWTPTPPTPGTPASHTLGGTLATARQAIRFVDVVFAQGFTIGDVTAADVTVSIGGASQPVQSVTVSGQQLTIALAAAVRPTSNTFAVTIGSNKITNPHSPGTYTASLATRSAAGSVIDAGSVQRDIGSLTVTLQAVVPNSLVFVVPPSDVLAVAADPEVGVSTVELPGQVVVRTNAKAGFTVTAQLSRPLTGLASGRVLPAITAGPEVLTTWDHATRKNVWGLTRRITSASDSCGATNAVGDYGTHWAGLSTAAGTLLSCSAPTNQTVLDMRLQVVVDFLQPADTYTATITYTATGNF